MDPEIFLYNTALSDQLPCLTSLSIETETKEDTFIDVIRMSFYSDRVFPPTFLSKSVKLDSIVKQVNFLQY